MLNASKPLTPAVLEEIVRRIVEVAQPERVILFGSAARGEMGPDSDVDLLVEFERPPTFLGYMDLIDHLEQLFGTRVGLATHNKLKPRARPYVERELIRVA